ncbi:MAG: NAD-dependent epimerase/dehydratase family protein, partial [Sediminibacterium sp.]|nr:NAD-dependent epimerase/dehydratase family protein [Sediminibacterium sp.]
MESNIQQFIFEDCKNSCNNIDNLTQLKNKTIFIAGATGFIGNWLTHFLQYLNLHADLNITLILLARDKHVFLNQFPYILNSTNIHFIESDIRNLTELNSEINYVIHAAANPNHKFHISQPLKTMDIITRGTQNLLELSTKLPKLIKFIYLSSHTVYGKTSQELIDENSVGNVENLDINNVYTASKRLAEITCQYYRKNLQLPIVILRPFSFIGPFQQQNVPWAINNFIRDAVLQSPIRVLGNPTTKRSYLYGSDVANIILNTLIKSDIGEVYNIGSNEPITLDKLAITIKDIVNP